MKKHVDDSKQNFSSISTITGSIDNKIGVVGTTSIAAMLDAIDLSNISSLLESIQASLIGQIDGQEVSVANMYKKTYENILSIRDLLVYTDTDGVEITNPVWISRCQNSLATLKESLNSLNLMLSAKLKIVENSVDANTSSISNSAFGLTKMTQTLTELNTKVTSAYSSWLNLAVETASSQAENNVVVNKLNEVSSKIADTLTSAQDLLNTAEKMAPASTRLVNAMNLLNEMSISLERLADLNSKIDKQSSMTTAAALTNAIGSLGEAVAEVVNATKPQRSW